VKLLLDTCTFVWIAEKSRRIPPQVVDLYESDQNEVYLSAASAWEIAIKHANGKMVLTDRPERLVPDQRKVHDILPLPIDEESALYAARLPFLHRDPFDRFLVGQAIVHGLTILTPDPLIAQYSVRVIW
jgi:PIN domain nuclease of toxin-antitoxin system